MADNQYFENAIKKHGFTGKGKGGNANYLREDFNKQTQGLDKDVAMEAMEGGRMFGASDRARYDKLMAQRSGAKEKAQNYKAGSNKNNQEDIGNTTQTVTQDNDQTSNITGDNNYVNQTQDNSVRNYGGDNRVFNYQGGSGNDSPASMATMAGFYAPDDSPSAQASRLDRHVTQNRDNQKKYASTSNIAQGAIARADQNRYIDPAALDKRIGERAEYHRAKSTLKGGQIFGDLFGMNGPTWNSAEPAEEVEKPDFEKMYDRYTDF